MRARHLTLVPLFAACAASDAADPAPIEDFLERSVAVRCDPVEGLNVREATVADVSMTGDGTLLVLYGQEREVALVGRDLIPRRVVRFTEDGPTGVRGPTSATLVGDSLLYIADQLRQAVKLLDLDGRDRGTIHVPFPPQQVRATAAGVLVTPLVLGRYPPRLVHRLGPSEVEPVAVPMVPYGDAAINSLANLVGLTAFPDGRIVVTHEFVEPFAHWFRAPDAGEVARVPLPVPEAVAAGLRNLPAGPLEVSEASELPVAALSAVPDPRSGDLLYLTRSGRRTPAGHFEKAVVRLDPGLRYRRSYILDVNAIRMAYLEDRHAVLVVDEVDRWYTCPAV